MLYTVLPILLMLPLIGGLLFWRSSRDEDMSVVRRHSHDMRCRAVAVAVRPLRRGASDDSF